MQLVALNILLEQYEIKANEGIGKIRYAQNCYFDDNYLIKEWTFRKGNAPEPSLSNTARL